MKLPDVTPAQKLAVIGWVVAQAISYGLLPAGQEQLEISIGATVLAAAWKLADAHIRHGRATGAPSGTTRTTVDGGGNVIESTTVTPAA